MTEQNEGSVNKALALQLEKNLNILEKDYSLMVFRIQATLSKLTHNNKVLSEIYQEGINQWCDSIEHTMGSFVSIVNECEKIEDTLQSVEILSKKIALFKNICEGLLKKQAEMGKASH